MYAQEGYKLKWANKNERFLAEEFMGLPEGYLGSIVTWNDIMPMVEKIESLHDEHHGYFGVHISSNTCTIQGTNLWKSVQDANYGAVYMSDPNAVLNTKIESTWYNIIQFIQWYKQNKKP